MERRAFIASLPSARVLGASDRIRVGLIGSGPRGQYLLKELLKTGAAECVAVCDVYDVRRAQGRQIAGPGAEEYLDHKQVVARNDIDAVIVATPDHWHAAITVDALNAGKDVYVEKPMVHFPKDGQAIVRAVRANKRILQVGTQGRGLQQFVEPKTRFIDSGIIGKVGMVRTWYTSNSGYVQQAPAGMERKPEGLDWERWLGSARHVPWDPGIYFSPYKWLHYDGGMIMGIGIHVVDSAHHWLNLKAPSAAVAMGGIYHYKDRDTPDVISFLLEYPQGLVVSFAAECLSAPGVRTSAGVEARGTGGVVYTERYQQGPGAFRFIPNSKTTQAPPAEGPGVPASAAVILQDWIDCIRYRKRAICNEEAAYYSTMACFMAAEAYKTKTRVEWNRAWDLPA
ncbi:MAG: Gfo/Idh/MocA family oxidoreductase [Bryobacteraceae bacterium]|nr:Gfo/Idh/MocA family oxidoreductase [Bryobacteraceae bacterium]